MMKPIFSQLCCALLLAAGAGSFGSSLAAPLAAGNPRQDVEVVRQRVQEFVEQQSASLKGQISSQIGRIDSRLNLPECAAPEVFIPKGSRLWGKSSVGVRCTSPVWSLFVQVEVRVLGEYIVTSHPLSAGQLPSPEHLTTIKGDLTSLPPGIVTDMAQIAGQTLNTSLPAGVPVRLDALKKQVIIQPGQAVRLAAGGAGFRVSSEARAIVGGSEGQVVQVRTMNGQQVSGIARAGGVVEVVN
jgi:flagella basal body P-ring formation protein FlgA